MGQKTKKSIQKEIREWGFFLLILIGLYASGAHVYLQRLILYTGIFTPNTTQSEEVAADYHLRLTSLEGNPLDFQELKGKTIFLNLWATWCPPCIAEMPTIQSLYDEMSAKEDIVFVMLSLDDDPQKARNFIQKKGYSFPVYFPTANLPAAYRSGSIPTTFVISPEGNIVSRNAGMANYNTRSFKEFLVKLSQ